MVKIIRVSDLPFRGSFFDPGVDGISYKTTTEPTDDELARLEAELDEAPLPAPVKKKNNFNRNF